MRRPITATLVALVVMGGLVVPIQGGQISGTFEGDSTLTPASPPGFFVQTFTGEGDDTIFGSFTAQSQSLIDFSNSPNILLNGMLFEIFPQGTLFGTTSGSGTASGHGTATVTVDFVITGGTGLFAGDTGEATLTATLTSTSTTTESITGSYSGSLSLVPEPSSLALLAPSLAVGAVVVVRRRRRKAMARQSA